MTGAGKARSRTRMRWATSIYRGPDVTRSTGEESDPIVPLPFLRYRPMGSLNDPSPDSGLPPRKSEIGSPRRETTAVEVSRG